MLFTTSAHVVAGEHKLWPVETFSPCIHVATAAGKMGTFFLQWYKPVSYMKLKGGNLSMRLLTNK